MNVPPLERILIVEDDPDIRTIAAFALEAVAGLEVRTCASGLEALREAERFAPRMILLDVMMPGMDGPATLAKLRLLPGFERTPVVFMTAKVQPDEVEKYRQLGVVEVIAKPFDAMTLGDAVLFIWSRVAGARLES